MLRATRLSCAILVALSLPASPVRAEEDLFDQLDPEPAYTLFRPTPRAEMRPITVDTVPFTVDPGHAQVEVDLINAAWEGSGGVMTDRRIDLFGFNARLGLTESIDAQIAWVPYRRSEHGLGGVMNSTAQGVGDATVRVKFNLWGNDGGRSAAALMPFVGLPTASGGVGAGGIEGGAIVPVFINLPGGVGSYVNSTAAFARNASGVGHHPSVAVTAGVTRPLAGPLGATVEWTTSADAEGALAIGHDLNAVANLVIGADEIDIGACMSMPDPQAALNPYVKMTIRR